MFETKNEYCEEPPNFPQAASRRRNVETPPATEVKQELVELLPKLLLHARRLTRSQQMAEDLVQSTCVRAIDRLHQWRPEKRLEAWVVTIMKSIWLNDRRRVIARDEQELENPDDVVSTGFESAANARLVLTELRERGVVSENDLSMIMKIHVHGFTYKELAEELCIPIGTLLSRVSRTKNALRRALQELHEESAA